MGRGRAPCCDKSKVRTGPWSAAEDLRLINFIQENGHSNWRALPKQAGLLRCGKSCRLRWVNYLRPDVKRGNFTPEEEQTIIKLHRSFGNKWSKIASCLPGRTDNEIKNVWNTHLKKRLKKIGEDCEKTKGEDPKSKMDCSAASSSSCTSSSTTTSVDENMEVKKPNHEKSESLNALSSSPSDYHNNNNDPNETPASDSPSPSDQANNNLRDDVLDNDDQLVQIASSEFDVDFWELLDSLDPLQPNETAQNCREQNTNISIIDDGAEKLFDGEVGGVNEWLRFFENELGLTSDDADHLMMMPEDHVTMTSDYQYQEMSFEPELSAAFDYSSVCPCSPQYLGI